MIQNSLHYNTIDLYTNLYVSIENLKEYGTVYNDTENCILPRRETWPNKQAITYYTGIDVDA